MLIRPSVCASTAAPTDAMNACRSVARGRHAAGFALQLSVTVIAPSAATDVAPPIEIVVWSGVLNGAVRSSAICTDVLCAVAADGAALAGVLT